MPCYVSDYLADTMDLTTLQHGAYLLLIFAYWRKSAPLPDDDNRLAAITKTTPAEWKRIRPVMASFFTISDGVWRQKRADVEIATALAKSAERSAAGKRGAESKHGKGRGLANGKTVAEPPEDVGSANIYPLAKP
jgi:uncharacterized protein YdaU (DUF1376 family)